MEQNPSKSLVSPSNSGALEKAGSGPKRILSLMMTDALVLARKKERALTQPWHWIGAQEFGDADYRQILNWAEALGMTPEVVLKQLSAAKTDDEQFKIVDCAIHTLIWDFSVLPILEFNWLIGLKIEVLVFHGQATAEIAPRLPGLKKLYCSGNQLTELDLAYLPQLTELICDKNQLTKLHLVDTPQLMVLWCSNNQLTELDMDNAPQLTVLMCDKNQLTELDLSFVPQLTVLLCDNNHLRELDLACVPGLTSLDCGNNHLTELDLACAPGLTKLWCDVNQLTELELACIPGLTSLYCSGNQLTELDLASVAGLASLSCYENQLTQLDITHLLHLNFFQFDPTVKLKKLPSQSF